MTIVAMRCWRRGSRRTPAPEAGGGTAFRTAPTGEGGRAAAVGVMSTLTAEPASEIAAAPPNVAVLFAAELAAEDAMAVERRGYG